MLKNYLRINPVNSTKMKLNIYTLIILLSSVITVSAQSPDWYWAQSAGGSKADEGIAITSDIEGNVFLSGEFESPTITFGNFVINNTGHGDIFIVKYDPSGNVLWAKGFGGTDDDECTSISADSHGNIYLAGYTGSKTLYFGNLSISNSGEGMDIFLAKLDAGGNALWAKNINGSDYEYGGSVATDPAGNVYLAGCFESRTLSIGNSTLTNAGDYDVFIAKYDPSGNPLWARSAGGNNDDKGSIVSTDAVGNVYLTGYFESQTISFGANTLTTAGNNDIFVVKYDFSGNVLWAKSAGGNGEDYNKGLAIDADGNVYVAGGFESQTMSFGNISLTNSGNVDVFIAKYDASGNVLWSKSLGGSNKDCAYGIALDLSGNLYLTGVFGSSSFMVGNATLPYRGYFDTFIAKYNPDGNVLWASGAGGSNNDWGNSIACNPNGDVYLTGTFESSEISFGTSALWNAGDEDVFIAKLNSSVGIDENSPENKFVVYPNPAKNSFSVVFPPSATKIRILKSDSRLLQESYPHNETKLEFSLQHDGIYIVQVTANDRTYTKKLVVCK